MTVMMMMMMCFGV